jgi:signal transduction histidine kinase
VDFHSSGWTGERLPNHVETTVYRIVQEALTNVLKHAQATRVSLIVERRENQAVVIIEDNGTGFDPGPVQKQNAGKRLGLLGMSERAALVGGEMNIESTPEGGTTIFVRIPLGGG